jgi:hypothetical protein
MTEDDIMLMALDAGPLTQGPFKEWCKRFANLAAAAEREACAELCDGLDDDLVDGLAGWQYGEAIRARGEQA